jgi:hypothetical protein
LRTAHHPLERTAKRLRIGEYREGVTLSRKTEGTYVDIGVDRPAIVQNKQLPTDKRITVKIRSIAKQIEVELVTRDEIPEFWGYTVTSEERPLGKILKSRNFDLAIATSRHGIPFFDVAEEIRQRCETATTILVALGAPSQGLTQIVSQEGLDLEDIVHFVVNTIPSQGTATVRTEEALIASLALLSVKLHH